MEGMLVHALTGRVSKILDLCVSEKCQEIQELTMKQHFLCKNSQ
jgi:hypothetical protein